MNKVLNRLEVKYTTHCKDEVATSALVRSLAGAIDDFLHRRDPQKIPQLHISLAGDLGSGKTTATRYLMLELGYTGKVKSPTYSLCEEYVFERPSGEALQVFHFDLYRMQSPAEWLEAGLAEHLSTQPMATLAIIEWPEKAEKTLPPMDLAITITQSESPAQPEARTVNFVASSERGQSIIQSLTPSF